PLWRSDEPVGGRRASLPAAPAPASGAPPFAVIVPTVTATPGAGQRASSPDPCAVPLIHAVRWSQVPKPTTSALGAHTCGVHTWAGGGTAPVSCPGVWHTTQADVIPVRSSHDPCRDGWLPLHPPPAPCGSRPEACGRFPAVIANSSQGQTRHASKA